VVFRVSVWPSGAGCAVDYDGPGLVYGIRGAWIA
jgi:hypothetical protein